MSANVADDEQLSPGGPSTMKTVINGSLSPLDCSKEIDEFEIEKNKKIEEIDPCNQHGSRPAHDVKPVEIANDKDSVMLASCTKTVESTDVLKIPKHSSDVIEKKEDILNAMMPLLLPCPNLKTNASLLEDGEGSKESNMEVVGTIARSLEAEPSLHKRVDLFFIVDSIAQCSRGLRGDVGGLYPSAVQAVLPRLLLATAPPGHSELENRRQLLKKLGHQIPDEDLQTLMNVVNVKVEKEDEKSSGAKGKKRKNDVNIEALKHQLCVFHFSLFALTVPGCEDEDDNFECVNFC
ncbi:hypothetical protein L2E82_08308 [Cichorium intybus]|uniref:Uncharacterized protein n=1 Tax=Cichorium intybus TaxID=13427 RepID=A0ACB9G5X0_CICIN|nr:hypothetical protein L2E82_08308 [Cichorium intybus]